MEPQWEGQSNGESILIGMILTNLGIFGNIISNGLMIIIDNIGRNLLTMGHRYSIATFVQKRPLYFGWTNFYGSPIIGLWCLDVRIPPEFASDNKRKGQTKTSPVAHFMNTWNKSTI